MIKKFFTVLLCLIAIATVTQTAFAQAFNQRVLKVQSESMVTPLKFNVGAGEKLDLNIVNESNNQVTFNIPLMSISEKVEKNSNKTVTLDFSQPADKNIWFLVMQPGNNNSTGVFTISDFTASTAVPTTPSVSSTGSSQSDSAFLNNLINYDTNYTYQEKPEPTYNVPAAPESCPNPNLKIKYSKTTPPQETQQTVAAPKTRKYVRGYW